MAKRSNTRKLDTKSVVEVKAEKAVSDTVLLKITIETIYKVRGAITGTEYIWRGAGDIQPVDSADAKGFLAKYLRRGCCGAGTLTKPVFVEV